MAPEIIDVDCNLWHKDLTTLQNKELDSSSGDSWNILKEDALEAANVVGILSPSSTIHEARMGLSRLKESPPPIPVKTTVGVHPYHVNDDDVQGQDLHDQANIIKSLVAANSEFCVAIGECGLDASEGFPILEDQIPWFRLQVRIAEELRLPLFVHERLAFSQTMDILEDASVPVIIHCFTGTKKQCIQYIERGYFISVSGYILKESNDNYEEVIACLKDGVIPLDKLMIETDAPYMGFDGCRRLYLEHNGDFVNALNSKKRKRLQQSTYPNVPSSLALVLDRVLSCLQENDPEITRDVVAKQTTANARALFSL